MYVGICVDINWVKVNYEVCVYYGARPPCHALWFSLDLSLIMAAAWRVSQLITGSTSFCGVIGLPYGYKWECHLVEDLSGNNGSWKFPN